MKLFEPFSLGKLNLKNRIVMPAISTKFGSDSGGVTDRYRDYYMERAKGGAGLIIIENTLVEYPRGKVSPTELRIDNHKFIPGLNDLAESIQEWGVKVAVQLHHAGRQSNLQITEGMELVSASDCFCSVTGGQARALTIPEIERITDSYAEGAWRAKIARFDAVEIHAAHGYLISQFLSPFINKRTDRYGQNLEGRCRFLLEIIKKIKDKVGHDFPIIVRFSADEMIPEGYHLVESKYLARKMEEMGVAALHVSAGVYESKEWIIQPMSLPPGCLTNLAHEIKKEVRIPIIAVGRINDARLAEQFLQEEKADMIAMGRALIADPYLPQKAQAGRFAEIRKCIACNHCIGRGSEGLRIKCAINSEAGREKEYRLFPAAERKKVVVLGGGPAGMEAARVASLRGHQVILFEKKGELGGQLNIASKPPGKSEITDLVEFLSNEMKRLRVDARLNREPSLAEIKALEPSVVIVATGAQSVSDLFPLIGRFHSVEEILSGDVPEGRRIAVVGGGQSGCEVAHFLAKQGKEVLLLEMREEIALGMESSSRKILLQDLSALGVETVTGFTVIRADMRKGIIEGRSGNSVPITKSADELVIAVGVKANREGLESIEEEFPELYWIGDCQQPANIAQAIHSAGRIGREI